MSDVSDQRRYYERMMDEIATEHRQQIDQLEAENAALRELLLDTLMDPRDYCDKYGIVYEGWQCVNDHLDDRMRELGLEVGA